MAPKEAPAREVSIFGTDATGKAFVENARVVSIDGFEVTLEGLSHGLQVGGVVGVRYAGRKERYQVVWLGHRGTAQQGQLGLRAVEVEKDLFTGADPQKPAWHERRRYPRIRCGGQVSFRREGSDLTGAGALKVLSEGGCFIETVATSPHLAHLDLRVNVEDLELNTVGEVHALQPGHGMGIAFVEMNPAQRGRLHDWVLRHSRSQPGI